MDERRAERLASNQALFRAVNERVAELNETFETRGDDNASFVCECSELDCAPTITFVVEKLHVAGEVAEQAVAR